MKLRFEKKYLVPNVQLDALRERFMPFLRADIYAGGDPFGYPEYTVRSIYFDSPDKKALDEKIAGIEERKKLRIRGYDTCDENSQVFLEVKRKIGNRIYKNRSLIPYSKTADVLLLGPDKELTENLIEKKHHDDAMRFLYQLKKYNMSPLNLIVYEREAYHGKFNSDLRITFDKNIRSAIYPSIDNLFDESSMTYVWDNHFILEVKYFDPPMPGFVKTIVEDFKLQSQALSKFIEGYFCHQTFAKKAI
jgi:hypothetical protein